MTAVAAAAAARAAVQDAQRSQRNLQFLQSHGLSECEARTLLARSPQLAGATLEGPAMRAKLLYCREALGLRPREVLLHHRGYLTEGLPWIDQRVSGVQPGTGAGWDQQQRG